MGTQTLRLNVDEQTALKLRQIADSSSSFQSAVERVMRERNVSEGKARLLVARQSGPKGGKLYHEWCVAGRQSL